MSAVGGRFDVCAFARHVRADFRSRGLGGKASADPRGCRGHTWHAGGSRFGNRHDLDGSTGREVRGGGLDRDGKEQARDQEAQAPKDVLV